MGGAAGHLSHVFEDRSLTFSDIKNILTRASLGTLNNVSEKFDGLNMVISWDSASDSLRIARSLSDIKSGGMDFSGLESKFKNRGNVAMAFTVAYAVLTKAFTCLGKETKIDIFGECANIWYSVEVIYRKNSNVIVYDYDAIVFHENPMFFKYGNQVTNKPKHFMFQMLLDQIPNMQNALIESSDWKILGPESISLPCMEDKSCAYDAIGTIQSLMENFNLLDSSSIEDYLSSFLSKKLDDDPGMEKCLPYRNFILERCLGKKGSSLMQIKKICPGDVYPRVFAFVDASPSLLKDALEPIEKIIGDFSNELLSFLGSRLILDSASEILRVKNALKVSIDLILEKGDKSQIDSMQKHLKKLGDIEQMKSCIEGIVFEYKENFYKFTGKFAAANQIMGILRYGTK